MASELYHQIVSEKGELERLIARIPGFRGYQEMQARRTADRLLRDHLAAEIDNYITRFNNLQTILLDGGKGLSFMGRAREVKARMQGYRDVIATAAPPYSGMWAQIKVTAETLDILYAFDEAQFRFSLQYEKALDAFETAISSGEGVTEALDQIDDVTANAREAFALRDKEILNLAL